MIYVFHKFVFYTFFNILIGLNGLVELSKSKVTDLITTEEIIRNCTNSVLSSLKLAKPVNFTRIGDYATTLHYFLSITFQDSDLLNEVAHLTRVYKGNIETEGNLTTIINELLDENSREYKANDARIGDSDASVVNYINRFLEKLKELKDNFEVNKVFSDINSNIIKIFRSANASYSEKNQIEKSTNDTVDNFDIFESGEFWQESGRRIFNAKRTKIKYFPFMASVHIFNTFQCAGSIIKSDIVITASSCLQLASNNRLYRENPAFLSVRVGSSFCNGGGENIPVLEIYFHPEYNPKTLRNNVCLVRLVRHIKFQYSHRRKVQKIAIDKQTSNMPTNIPGVTILGWGSKGISDRLRNPWENILSYAILDVYPLRECQEIYTGEYVTNKNFCGGFFSKGGGACNRDVGAPGVVDGILMGVVSFGPPVCGTSGVPTVFTKLGYYYNWIQNIMDMEIPHGGRATTLQILNPFDVYLTTQYTTAAFEIEPLGKHFTLKPRFKPMPALEEDEESMLRNRDGNLFQDFLRTMFGDDEIQKYKYLIDQMKKKKIEEEVEKYYKEKKEISKQSDTDGYEGSELSEQTQISKPNVGRERLIDLDYKPFTSGYDSKNHLYPNILQDYKTGNVTENDYPVTQNTSDQQELNHKTEFVHITQHGKRITRYNIISSASTLTKIVEQSTSSTTKLAKQKQLELVMASSEESEDSDELLSDEKDDHALIKGEPKTIHSQETSVVPGEESLSKLLDEIDLDEIIKEVSDTKQALPERYQVPQSERYGSLFKPSSTSLVPMKRKVKGKVKNYKNKRQGHDFDKSKRTLLHSSSTKKKNNIYVDSRSYADHTQSHIVQPSNSLHSESIYKVIPKDNVLEIISEVLRVAVDEKKK